ncbi:MAG: EamA family transporter [Planctomycetaceae bacterium]|nr:EamA family transporter [Planctomycetaceae bacterium]
MTWLIVAGLLMTMLGAFASLFLKMAASTKSLRLLIWNSYFYLGGFLYVASAFVNIWLLGKFDYSLVLPLTSVTYVWTTILGRLVLNERLSLQSIGGLALIIGGASMLMMGE